MKYKMSILVALIFSLNGMDAPQETSETVPVKLQDVHTKEYRKFHRYHLETPETFLAMMREAFNYDGNKEKYLKNVQALASALLAQHQAMNFLGENAYFAIEFYKIKDEFYKILNQLHIKVINDEIMIYNPETPEQLNIVLAHADIVRNNDELLSEQEKAIIFSWILDSTKGPWLNNLGLLRKNTHEGALTDEERSKLQEKMEHSILPAAGSPFYNITEQLIKENTPYVSNVSQENKKLYEVEEKISSAAVREQANRQYTQSNAQTAQLYRIHQKEYQQLYEIVLKELKNVYQEAVTAKQKISPVILLPIPEQLRKQNYIPAKFPEKLADIKNPATYLTPFSLDSELEKARVEWEKSQAQAPAKKKYVRRRKKESSAVEPAAPTEIAEPVALAPAKIRTASDDSYIAEGGEGDIQIIIEDPKNDATITLFKTKMTPANAARLKNLPRKDYTPNVQQWFDEPEKARIEQGHTDPNSPKYRAGEPAWKPITLHSFSRLVDDYLYQYGTVGEVDSRSEKDKKDILVTVPGKIEYRDGTEETGVFAYIIDSKNGKWYHRMFTPHASKNLVSDLFSKGYFAPEMTGYYDVFFPALAPRKK